MNLSQDLITAAFIEKDEEKCAFESILPNNQNCPFPGVWVELLLFILSLVKKSPKIRLIHARSYDFTNNTEKGSSMMGLLLTKKANVSPPYMTLSYRRANLLPHSTPFFITPLAYGSFDLWEN